MSQQQADTGELQTCETIAQTVPVCPACSTRARRVAARYCSTCGRALAEHDYLPADTLRSSYHQQHRHPSLMPGHEPHRACISPRKPIKAHAPFAAPLNNATQLAHAFITYALVPYLGILFCPGAIICGIAGLWLARDTHTRGSTHVAARSILLGFIILSAQAFLWWILYLVPRWSRL